MLYWVFGNCWSYGHVHVHIHTHATEKTRLWG